MMTSAPARRMQHKISMSMVSKLNAPALSPWYNMAYSPDTYETLILKMKVKILANFHVVTILSRLF